MERNRGRNLTSIREINPKILVNMRRIKNIRRMGRHMSRKMENDMK